ncbi:hypothetical protein O3M35_007106 [Rhynocoris fuscipes]|uniref:Uncharacterized protein n=1 Tax=Rhynocoris fuscipes TaxID=488301 RepID=A0AAW1DDH1_9HEMI
MERWAGRVAVVTGASSGIGEHLAKELTKHGMKVAALARRIEKLQKLEQECQSLKGLLKVYKCDVSVEEEIASIVKQVVADLGPISVLINNAGVMFPVMLTDTKASGRQMFETNVIGTVCMTQHTVEVMRKHNINDGHIININSIAGHGTFPAPGMSNYCASKNALTVVTESLKNELSMMKLNIRVTSISPGFVKTEMSDKYAEGRDKDFPKLYPEDITECIVFILALKSHINISEMTIQPTTESIMSLVSK